MNKFILGKKVGMTQVFDENGLAIPVTVLEAGPCTVVQKKTVENDGYQAVRIGFVDEEEKNLNRPDKGIFLKTKTTPKKYLKEFTVEDINKYEIGQEIKADDMFQLGDKVDVSGISKGKGFQGNIKRHGYSRGPETHGSTYHRRPGSLGAGSSPGRVFKGKRLPGHMGSELITVQNLEVVKANGDNNMLLVKGAVPGPRGGLITIKGTVKSGK